MQPPPPPYYSPPPPPPPPPPATTSRRALLTGTGVALVAGTAGFFAYGANRPVTTTSAPGGGAGGDLAKLADIPKNGGLILTEQKIVLTRDSGDDVKAFSAVCTHRQCLVTRVEDGFISCRCHGSVFNSETGEVVDGPAPAKLPGIPISVVDGIVREG